MDDFTNEYITELKLDRSDWQLVKFGDVAIQQKQAVDRENTELTRYVKGEHMASEDLHLRKWGELTDEYLGPAFIRKFEKGDILYGSRRTYLRKVAKAHFDGITSNTTFVIKANETRIDKRLLPFIMLSEGFAEHSIRNSKGSVNPYVNWKDIAGYEFLIPPKNQQAKLAELLEAIDEVIQKELRVKFSNSDFFESTRNSIFNIGSSNHPLSILKDITFSKKAFARLLKVKMRNGIYKSKDFQGQGERMINMGELFAYPVIKDEVMSLITLSDKEKEQYLVEEGDLIFARRSLVVEGAGKCSIIGKHNTPMTFESSMIRVRLDSIKVSPKYIYHFLKSNEGKKSIRRIVGFTTVAGITSSDLANVKVPIVSVERQNLIVEHLDMFDSLFLSLDFKIKNSKSLQKSLINQIF